MSAIAGIYHFNKEPVPYDHSMGLMQTLQKYPADDIQLWQQENIFLGCHNQWITPESVGEQLPYHDYERQLTITADAIIDNREQLFQKLQIGFEEGKLMPDSQVILLAYQKWGEHIAKHLLGDFAFMIWDEKKQQLVGARDPSGYRNLYYYQDQYRFVFCTTIEPLLSLPYIDMKLNEQWVAEFLAISGMTDTIDACTTPYQSINELPPFHTIIVKKNKSKIEKYGTFTPEKRLKLKSNEEYIEAFQEVFQGAVNSRLRTHRNIGSQLSGGLDSGSVVGFAARKLHKENKILHTFSYIPPKDFVDYTPRHLMPDERPAIKATVQYVGGIDDSYYDFEGRSSYSEIEHCLEAMEMPYKFLENSFWLRGMFEKANEKGIGILLNGDRGNFTVSWGAALPYYARLLKKLKWGKLFQELDQYSKNVSGPRLRRVPIIAKTAFPSIARLSNKHSIPLHTQLIHDDFAGRTGVFQKLRDHGMNESGGFASESVYEHRRILYEDIVPWNTGNTLNSKLSLRYGVWKRDPTNDTRVIRFCRSLPEEQYVQNGLDRALIRRATENILPEAIRLNQKVRGAQAADWIHRMIPHWDSFIREAKQLCMEEKILEFVKAETLNTALDKAKEGPMLKYSHSEYSILMRYIILARFIKKFN